MTGRELAIEFTDLWKELEIGQINTMLAKNVPFELLEFFSSYAQEFVEEHVGPKADPADREALERHIPNLLVIGYIIRVLEERIPD